MASAKDLRKRITSVKNTQQITKAMKMVSAAKLRRAQDSIMALRPFALELQKVLAAVSVSAKEELNHPLLTPKEESEVKKILVILVTSDRGLCGAFNSNIIKTAQRFLKTNASKYEKLDFAFIGKKGYEFFRSRKAGKYYQNFFVNMKYAKAKQLAEELIGLYSNGEYDEIRFIYNEFKSAISQKVNVETFLPVKPEEAQAESSESTGGGSTIFEPGAKEIIDALLPKHFATHIFRIALESLASEHGARMAAMENATKNASEMVRKLTLVYNRTRQAGITKELLEITSGAEAQRA
ncbi:MAG: ATP synthase F1 subunit gamma [Bacteriovoracia bacterium]